MGFLRDDLGEIKGCIGKSHGMILVTGPTGSGKSSTIYACLKQPVFAQKNIVTLEDPVEYELPGINQVQIRSNIGFTFARGLRQVLRHDPDVIMVGEMRDAETARIGVQAALTGHLLISTLHTNNASEAYVRLVDMEVEPYLVSATVICVLSQRLIRKICPECKDVDPQGAEKLKMSHFPVESYEDITFYKGKGCETCNKTGYKGRTVAYEVLMMGEDIKRAVVKGENSLALRSLAIKKGMKTIEETAFHKAKEGVTSVEEAIHLAAG
jgi:type IV pilus assembly protein PilB